MKRTVFTFMAAMAIMQNAAAQTDTLVVKNADEVKVITTGDTLSVSISGKKDEPNYYFYKTVAIDAEKEDETTSSKNVGSRLGWDFSLIEDRNSTSEIELGFVTQLSAGWSMPLGKPSGMKTKWFPTEELGLDVIQLTVKPAKAKWWVSLDWGALYNKYVLKDCMMTTTQDGNVGITPYPEGSGSQSSYFHTFSSNLTLMGHYYVSKNDYLGLGVSWISRVMDNGSYKSKYALSDGTEVVDMNELPIRRNLFSIKAEYMMNRGGFFLRYTPMSMFHKGKGPSFSQLSLGFQIRL